MELSPTGNPVYYGFTDDMEKIQDPMVPGICNVCGALVPGINTVIFTDVEFFTATELHNDWHRKHGDL